MKIKWVLFILVTISFAVNSCGFWKKEKKLVKQYDSIFLAVHDGDIDAVKEFIKKDPKLINAINPSRQNHNRPLHVSIITKHFNISNYLIENGADIEAKDSFEDTPLHLAILSENVELVKNLLNKGADINGKGPGGFTPLQRAVIASDDPLIVKLLLEKGANVNIKDNDGITPLISAAALNRKSSLNLLIEKNADVNDIDRWGKAALDYAIDKKYYEIVKQLQAVGAKRSPKKKV